MEESVNVENLTHLIYENDWKISFLQIVCEYAGGISNGLTAHIIYLLFRDVGIKFACVWIGQFYYIPYTYKHHDLLWGISMHDNDYNQMKLGYNESKCIKEI